jgi:hypothetical protein
VPIDKIHTEARAAIDSYLDEKFAEIDREFREFVQDKNFNS